MESKQIQNVRSKISVQYAGEIQSFNAFSKMAAHFEILKVHQNEKRRSKKDIKKRGYNLLLEKKSEILM